MSTTLNPPPRPFGRPATVVLADDECMFRSSLRHLLTAPPSVIKDFYGAQVGAGFQVVGEARSGEETVAVVKAVKPDLLLGVRGLVLKDSPTELLFEALVAVMAGRHWLGQALVVDLVELVRSMS